MVGRFRDAARGDLPGTILLDGPHLVAEALRAGMKVKEVLVSSAALGTPEIERLAAELGRTGAAVAETTTAVMDAVSPVRSPSPIVALADRPVHDRRRMFADAATLIVIAADVQDPGNAGAIIRVAEAGGATGVIVAGKSAEPFGWKALRGSMGSALRLPIQVCATVDEAVAVVRSHRCRTIATAPRAGRSLYDADLTGPSAIVVGGEGPGLPETVLALADERVTIPMQAPVESLNTAIAAALMVYEARRQRTSR
jgi:TrmH family RNA methyltransferase